MPYLQLHSHKQLFNRLEKLQVYLFNCFPIKIKMNQMNTDESHFTFTPHSTAHLSHTISPHCCPPPSPSACLITTSFTHPLGVNTEVFHGIRSSVNSVLGREIKSSHTATGLLYFSVKPLFPWFSFIFLIVCVCFALFVFV